MHLLVADDNEINLRVACAYLKSIGVPESAIATAANGQEAIDLCLVHQFDLVFMDIQMPKVDGVAAAKEILQNHDHKPAIVALTANMSPDSEREYLDIGMQMVIHKPVSKTAFLEALQLAHPNVA